MSRLPAFAQGVQFCVDTTPDRPPESQQHFSPRNQWEQRPRFQQRNYQGGSDNFRGPPRHGNHRGFRNFGPRPPFGQGSGQGHGPRQWAPRRPNFSNPYERQLTPRNYAPRQQRWQHTSRGGRAPLAAGFGPCASGATAETLAIIDDFVKPSMLEDPWKSFENTSISVPPKKSKFDSDDAHGDCPPSTSRSPAEDISKDEEAEFNLKDFIPNV